MTAAETTHETSHPRPGSRLRRHLLWIVPALIIAVGILIAYQLFTRTVPVTYDDPVEHFKYGSIGSEPASGIPYWIFRALPRMFADKLPAGSPPDYSAFGLLYEPGKDLPIGTSVRKVTGIDRVWLNCSVCHVGTVRAEPGGEQQLILGAPSNNLRLFDFIQFMRSAAVDNRWQPDHVLEKIEEAGGNLGLLERLVYRYIVIDQVRAGLLALDEQLRFLDRQAALGHDWGPGRVDTFNPYKKIQFNYDMARIPDAELTGAADYPSIWMQRPRQGMNLHWDGNNASVDERNLSASLGAGVTPTTIDMAGIERVRDWIWELPAPPFPTERIDQAKAAAGAPLYARYCAACHGAPGSDGYDYDRGRFPHLGEVVPLSKIGTDPGRWRSYTSEFAGDQNMLFAGYPRAGEDCDEHLCSARFTHFKKTDGYANQPLDGIWARSPYLHNGSVPTLRALLDPAEERPATFYRGSDVYDWDALGYVQTPLEGDPGAAFLFDTRLPGNANSGHQGPAYGTDLPAADKDAIVEYMKTF